MSTRSTPISEAVPLDLRLRFRSEKLALRDEENWKKSTPNLGSWMLLREPGSWSSRRFVTPKAIYTISTPRRDVNVQQGFLPDETLVRIAE